jgi:hypothetical protein
MIQENVNGAMDSPSISAEQSQQPSDKMTGDDVDDAQSLICREEMQSKEVLLGYDVNLATSKLPGHAGSGSLIPKNAVQSSIDGGIQSIVSTETTENPSISPEETHAANSVADIKSHKTANRSKPATDPEGNADTQQKGRIVSKTVPRRRRLEAEPSSIPQSAADNELTDENDTSQRMAPRLRSSTV